MAGTFEIYLDKAGEYRFRLKASNGQVVLSSEGYKAKASALNGAESVERNCEEQNAFERSTTASGKYRFNMKARNGQVIGVSQSYASEGTRDNGIASIARAAKGATIVDLTG